MKHWADVYQTLFGRALNSASRKEIDTEISRAFEGRHSVMPGEVTRACQSLAEGWTVNFPPSVANIISEMKSLRRKYIEAQNGELPGTHLVVLKKGDGSTIVNESADEWQRQLRVADDEKHRWEIICKPQSDVDCKEREDYCVKTNLHYEKFSFDPQKITEGVLL